MTELIISNDSVSTNIDRENTKEDHYKYIIVTFAYGILNFDFFSVEQTGYVIHEKNETQFVNMKNYMKFETRIRTSHHRQSSSSNSRISNKGINIKRKKANGNRTQRAMLVLI